MELFHCSRNLNARRNGRKWPQWQRLLINDLGQGEEKGCDTEGLQVYWLIRVTYTPKDAAGGVAVGAQLMASLCAVGQVEQAGQVGQVDQVGWRFSLQIG